MECPICKEIVYDDEPTDMCCECGREVCLLCMADSYGCVECSEKAMRLEFIRRRILGRE